MLSRATEQRDINESLFLLPFFYIIHKNISLYFCFLFSQESFSFLPNAHFSLALSALSMCLLSVLHFHLVVLFESFATEYNATCV